MTEPIVTTIAGKLAGEVVRIAGPRISRALLGSEESRAYASAFRRALETSISEHSHGIDLARYEPQLHEFFGDREVSAALVELALPGDRGDREAPKRRLEKLGLDPTTFPLDVDRLTTTLIQHLIAELTIEGSRHQSKIFNALVMAKLDVLQRQHAPTEPPTDRPPPIPSLVMGRQDDVDNLKLHLGIGASAPPPVTQGQRKIAAIYGGPGVGKTTVAQALAHDAEVRAKFPDGVLWATLTEPESVETELREWALARRVALARGTPIERVSASLRSHVAACRMLLVLDDVWIEKHAEPFDVAGPNCALLITTRDVEIAFGLAPAAACVYRLEPLTNERPLELLRALAPRAVAAQPEDSVRLASALGGLPLALQVAGRMLQAEGPYGLDAAVLLQDLLRKGTRLFSAKPPAAGLSVAGNTVAALLSLSIDRLSDSSAATIDHFAVLGAFAPSPASFSLDALASVWHVDDPVPIARGLANVGLIGERGIGRFEMHALLTAYARSILEERR